MGPKFCNATCLASGAALAGTEHSTVSVAPAEECQAKCIKEDQCVAFSYNTFSFDCKLLKTTTSAIAQSSAISGPKACDYCAEYDVLISTTSAALTAVSSEDCRGKCQANPSCKFYTYNLGDKVCLLATSDSGKMAANNKFVSAGDKYCGMEHTLAVDCYEMSIRLSGSADGTESNIKSIESCRRVCYERDHCLYFSWQQTTAQCELFKVWI